MTEAEKTLMDAMLRGETDPDALATKRAAVVAERLSPEFKERLLEADRRSDEARDHWFAVCEELRVLMGNASGPIVAETLRAIRGKKPE